MPTKRRIATAGTALLALPPLAAAGGPPASPGNGADGQARRAASTQTDPPGPTAQDATKATAYERYCRRESNKHVAGQTATPYGTCMAAAAKLRDRTTSAGLPSRRGEDGAA